MALNLLAAAAATVAETANMREMLRDLDSRVPVHVSCIMRILRQCEARYVA